jgi:hypothetical protein
MKSVYTTLFAAVLCLSQALQAQTFSDNFDSYTAGAYLTKSNSSWKTWSNTSGGTDDIKISATKAKSGSNALYFGSTAGGPNDIVLPFGGQYNTGTLHLEMNIFVDNLKKAYVNLQEQSTNGKGWAIDLNFDSTGGFNIVNTLSGTLLTGTYTQNQWMLIALDIDLTSNTWNFSIDGTLKGSFQNSYRQFASMNIYAIANSSFWVDDVAYTFTPYVKPALNGSLTYIDNVTGRLASSVLPSVEIRNTGTQAITSATIELTYNGNTQSKTLSGINLAYLATQTIQMDKLVSLTPGNSTISATLKQVNGGNDDILTDNTKSLVINAPAPAANKMVVAEEATGTWCQWCPRGAVWLKKMDDKYNGFIIGIAVHNNDPMTYGPYDQGLGTKIKGYPSMVVDRGIAKDPSAMESDFLTRIMVAPKATIRSGAKYDATTRQLDVSLTTKFKQAVNGNYRIAFVLVEDSVTGTAAGYKQSNAYAGGGSGVMGGFELLPNPVPANKMVYDHVGRFIAPNFAGLSNAFPTSVNAGDSFTHNFSYTLDASWNVKKMHLVGLLIDPTGKIDNGSKADIDEAIKHGYLNGKMVADVMVLDGSSNGLSVYPNPSNGKFTMQIPAQYQVGSELHVYNMQGQLVKSEIVNGSTNLTIDAQNWPAGCYLCTLQNSQAILKVKLIKE